MGVSGVSLGNSTHECSICLGEIRPLERSRAIPCNHEFDIVCINAWLDVARNSACPLCRERITHVNGVPVVEPEVTYEWDEDLPPFQTADLEFGYDRDNISEYGRINRLFILASRRIANTITRLHHLTRVRWPPVYLGRLYLSADANQFLGIVVSYLGFNGAAICQSALSVLTLGKVNEINHQLSVDIGLARDAFSKFIRALGRLANSESEWKVSNKTGIVSSGIVFFHNKFHIMDRLGDSLVAQEVGKRAYLALYFTALRVTKLYDLCIGLIAGGVALVTLGKSSTLNTFALRELRSGYDPLFYSFNVLRALINPHQLALFFPEEL